MACADASGEDVEDFSQYIVYDDLSFTAPKAKAPAKAEKPIEKIEIAAPVPEKKVVEESAEEVESLIDDSEETLLIEAVGDEVTIGAESGADIDAPMAALKADSDPMEVQTASAGEIDLESERQELLALERQLLENLGTPAEDLQAMQEDPVKMVKANEIVAEEEPETQRASLSMEQWDEEDLELEAEEDADLMDQGEILDRGSFGTEEEDELVVDVKTDDYGMDETVVSVPVSEPVMVKPVPAENTVYAKRVTDLQGEVSELKAANDELKQLLVDLHQGMQKMSEDVKEQSTKQMAMVLREKHQRAFEQKQGIKEGKPEAKEPVKVQEEVKKEIVAMKAPEQEMAQEPRYGLALRPEPERLQEIRAYQQRLQQPDQPREYREGAAGRVARMVPGKIISDRAAVRSGPDRNNPRLMMLSRGTTVSVDYWRDGWYRIFTPNGVRAWVSSGDVEFIN